MTFDEVSNNVYKVTLTDHFGRLAETTDTDLENAITTVETYAFDIEKQYHDEAFGSWYILLTDNRILLDGRDFILCIQVYKNDWVDTKTIKLSELTYANFVTAINGTQ